MQRSLKKRASKGPADLKRMTPSERVAALVDEGVLDEDDAVLLDDRWAEALDGMAESVIGSFPVPLGVARHFVIDGVPRLVALATEERSVVAAASKGAKLALPNGFATRTAPRTNVRGHILFSRLPEAKAAFTRLLHAREEIADEMCRAFGPTDHGRGFRDLDFRLRESGDGDLVTITLSADSGEAMGANKITRMAERLAATAGGIVGVRHAAAICTNRDSGWHVAARAVWPARSLGDALIGRILDLQRWAEVDADRAVTHNKGIMNGVTAVCLATGQDTRAVEASAHSGAAADRYRPLTRYRKNDEGDLEGEMFLWLPIGTKGGATRHPMAAISRKIMRVANARELAAVCAAVGLAQNFAALRALADEGIPGSHERLAHKE
jgi:hydroxymethylglutaryl-CoA reductase